MLILHRFVGSTPVCWRRSLVPVLVARNVDAQIIVCSVVLLWWSRIHARRVTRTVRTEVFEGGDARIGVGLRLLTVTIGKRYQR